MTILYAAFTYIQKILHLLKGAWILFYDPPKKILLTPAAIHAYRIILWCIYPCFIRITLIPLELTVQSTTGYWTVTNFIS